MKHIVISASLGLALSSGAALAADAQQLLKEGGNLYAAAEGATPQLDTKSIVQQGYIEKSNVNSVTEMSNMIAISRAYQSVANILQQQSDQHRNALQQLSQAPNSGS